MRTAVRKRSAGFTLDEIAQMLGTEGKPQIDRKKLKAKAAELDAKIRELIAMAEPGDMVLIAGKGERTHQIIGNTAVPFNDREIAAEYLQHSARPHAGSSVGPALCAA